MKIEVQINGLDQESVNDFLSVPEDARLVITSRDSIEIVMAKIRSLTIKNPVAKKFFYELGERMTVELYQ